MRRYSRPLSNQCSGVPGCFGFVTVSVFQITMPVFLSILCSSLLQIELMRRCSWSLSNQCSGIPGSLDFDLLVNLSRCSWPVVSFTAVFLPMSFSCSCFRCTNATGALSPMRSFRLLTLLFLVVSSIELYITPHGVEGLGTGYLFYNVGVWLQH